MNKVDYLIIGVVSRVRSSVVNIHTSSYLIQAYSSNSSLR